MSKPKPGIVVRRKHSSAALAVNPLSPACVSRMPGSRKAPHHAVERAAHEVPSVQVVEEARAHEVARVGQHATGDRDVGAARELVDDALDLIERIREVDVGEHAVAAARGEHAARHGVALAAVVRVAQHADPGAPFAKSSSIRRVARVARAVVDEQHLDASRGARGEVVDRLERGRELIRRVVHGDHERQGGYVRRRTEHRCLVTSGDGACLRVGNQRVVRAPRRAVGRTPAAWPRRSPLIDRLVQTLRSDMASESIRVSTTTRAAASAETNAANLSRLREDVGCRGKRRRVNGLRPALSPRVGPSVARARLRPSRPCTGSAGWPRPGTTSVGRGTGRWRRSTPPARGRTRG